MSANPFPEHLRGEYDDQLFDLPERRKKARQLQTAFDQAQLWQPPRSILDVGCGTGLILANLDGGMKRVGCDVRGELFVPSATVAFVQAQANQLPFRRQSFDLVLCMAVIEELENWRAALEVLTECVAEGGVLYVTFTNGRWLTRIYALEELLGFRRNAVAWHYARNSLDYPLGRAKQGFDLNALKGWRCVDVTPYLARASMPVLRALPLEVVTKLVSWAAPSLGFAWRKPILGKSAESE